ncbi:phage virion morphogenesis protein [Nitrosomonas communis]|uniref:phage virion morphogenesis protein n=1 Tax=Nitrosomonas communis TaxID=44574 RepID=UPI0026F0CC80|nr:phage virion morphogenesis protein [Nitrosomonas communis]MCO6427313.1 phage virion morphogenesis protein [Nitrosomonas communis]
MKIQIEVDNKTVLDALNRLQQSGARPRPALLEIGEALVESTKERFSTQTMPDGSRWERNAPAGIGSIKLL